MDLRKYFQEALNYKEYINLLADHLTLHQQHYSRLVIPDDRIKTIKSIQPLNILVLTEPWCGDSLAILPVIRKLSEVNGKWGFKILLRDQNLELMDQFLTRGGRAVPIFLFLDQSLSFIFRWGPRPQKAQRIFEKYRQSINNGSVLKLDVMVKIRNFYARDRGQSILHEICSILQNFNLVSKIF
jgi:hypothetical protein